jgi:hypothetical protein
MSPPDRDAVQEDTMNAKTSMGRMGLWAVAAMLMAGCAPEEAPTTDSSSEDVKEKRGKRAEVVDPFAPDLCTGEGISLAQLTERFGGSELTLSVQMVRRERACNAGGCSEWSAPFSFGVVDGPAAVTPYEGEDRLLLSSQYYTEFTGQRESGEMDEAWWITFMAVELADTETGMVMSGFDVRDLNGWVGEQDPAHTFLADSVETWIDTTCMRTLATLPLLSQPGADVGTQFQYAFYASVEVEESAPRLVITEVDYAQPGKDTREFVEIRNEGNAPADLRAIDLELVDGRDDDAYFVVALDRAAAVLEPGETLVVGASALQDEIGDARFIRLRSALQDGPDGVRLVDTQAGDGAASVLDQIRYGVAAEQLADGTTRPALIDGGNGSICRSDQGIETCSTPSPGR